MQILKCLTAVAILIGSSVTNAQQFPENNCAQYFQYLPGAGELTLPSMAHGRNRLDVRFSQRGNQDQAVVGALLPYPDEATVRESVANQRPVKFRLSLWPDSSGSLPKLTRFAYNDAELCSASEYERPHSFFNRFYEIHFNALPTRQFGNQPPAVAQLPSSQFDQQSDDVLVKTFVFNPNGARTQAPWLPAQQPPVAATTAPAYTPWPAAALPWPTAPALVPQRSWPQQKPAPQPPIVAPEQSAVITQHNWPQQKPAPQPPVQVQVPNTSTNPPLVPNAPSDLSLICGREGAFTPYIYKGETYERGKYPWLAAIFHKVSRVLSFKCGGSLVSANMVITAAHCVYQMNEDQVMVAMGRYDIDDFYEAGAEFRQCSVRTHPEYSTLRVADADIALLTLSSPVVFNDIISPICLWSESETSVTTGSIAGWGTSEQGNPMTRFPRVVEAAIATEAECVRSFKVPNKVSSRTLCAGNLDGSGPCLGDSGGGLMMRRNNQWQLRAIVSLGIRGTVNQCNLNQYVLYCDVSKHMTWILEHFKY